MAMMICQSNDTAYDQGCIFRKFFSGALGLEIYNMITICFTSKYLECELSEVFDVERFKVINFLKERAIAF